jgi:glycosyltransferase involved in cell wall biosynthesis
MLVAKAFQKPNPPRTRYETEALLDSGYGVYVFAWDRGSEFPSLENVDGTIVRSFSLARIRKLSGVALMFGGILFQIWLGFQTVKLIGRLKQRPIIHAHDINTLFPGYLIKTLGLSSALIYDCRELTYGVYSDYFHPIVGATLRVIEEHLVRRVDAVITVTDSIANYIRRFCQTVVTIYNCPRLADIPTSSKREIRLRLGLPVNSFIVSSVGTIRRDCRFDLLRDVASLVGKDDIRFVVVGDGDMLPMLKKAEKQIPDAKLIVSPAVNREEALRYVFASDLTWAVYESRYASMNARIGLPWKFLESIACGVPLVVESDTYRAKLVEDLDCGIVLRNDRPEEVLQAIASIAKDPRRRVALSTNAKNAAITRNLSWEAMSVKLISLYDTLRQPSSYD